MVRGSANESVPFPDYRGDGRHGHSEMVTRFESNNTDKMPFSKRPVNKRGPIGRDRNSPF
jgi:hypothetical protein